MVASNKYNIIYADPPWYYRTWSDKGRGRCADSHYPVMKLDDIKALPVSEISAQDCALCLWATYPLLPEALGVLESWGFAFKTVLFTWIKTTRGGKWHVGMGHYTRANPEIVLLGTRGRLPRISKAVRNLVIASIGQHSDKPPEVRERIVELFGDLPRIELFARGSVDGWDALGNDVDGRDIREALGDLID